MSRDRWKEVEQYFADLLFPSDAALDAALADSVRADLPPINVSAAQGRFLAIIARMIGARRILEIGTLGGYSGIWLARALPPGGRLVTLEFVPGEDRVSPPMSATFPLVMLATTAGGDAYTFAELERMLRAAGFADNELHQPEDSPQQVIVST